MTRDLVERQCTATAKQTGERCRNRPAIGALVCRFHGGGAPQVKARAMERMVEAEARSMLDRLGEPDQLGHPVDELLAVAAECRGWLAVLRQMVAEMGDLTRTDRNSVEREAAIVALYERALDRTGRLLVDMNRLDLEARKVQIAQSDAQAIFDVIMAVLGNPELSFPTEKVHLFRALTNRVNPEFQALARDVFTDEYMTELCQRYPKVKRTGVVFEGVVDQEIALLTMELREIARLGGRRDGSAGTGLACCPCQPAEERGPT